MNYKINILPDYLEIQLTGEYSFSQYSSLIDLVLGECKISNRTRILVDMMTLSGGPTDQDKFLLGERAAKVMNYPIKTLVLNEKSKNTGFAENVAVNRGARLLVTDDCKAGLEWLLS